MTTLDTNVLLRWLLNDVPEQTASVNQILAAGETYAVPDAAIVETAFVLERSHKIPRPDVAAALELLLSVPQFSFDQLLWNVAVVNYRNHPKLSIVDCYLAARAERDGSGPLYTFDKKLANQLDVAVLLS